MRKIFRGNLNEAISVNQVASFRFPRNIFLKRKLTIALVNNCFWPFHFNDLSCFERNRFSWQSCVSTLIGFCVAWITNQIRLKLKNLKWNGGFTGIGMMTDKVVDWSSKRRQNKFQEQLNMLGVTQPQISRFVLGNRFSILWNY